jgi:hypothetical protein
LRPDIYGPSATAPSPKRGALSSAA